jgi:hypothetical protein
MRLALIPTRLPRLPLPRLADIGAAMMVSPNPCGRTFESFVPPVAVEKLKRDMRH